MTQFIDRFENSFNGLSMFFAGCVAISIGLFAVLIPLDLLIRSLGLGNMPWLHEGIEYVLYIGVFLGAPWVLQQGAHVRVDVVIAQLPKNLAVTMEIFLDLVGLMICIFLCYYGLLGSIDAYVDNSIPDKLLKIANWWMILVFAVSFFMTGIEFLLRIRRARRMPDGENPISTDIGF